MCMEATGEYLQLPFILLSSSLLWDNILNRALVWVWVGWLSSKPQGLSFISLSRARTAGMGHHTWLSRWCWRSAYRSSRVHATKHQVTLQLLIYCLLVLVCPSCEYFHSSKIEHGVLGDPISLQCLSQNDFSGSVISYRITTEFDSKIVHLKQNKVLLPLFWGRCLLFLLRLSSEQWKSVFHELMVEFKMLPSEIGLTKWVCYFNTLFWLISSPKLEAKNKEPCHQQAKAITGNITKWQQLVFRGASLGAMLSAFQWEPFFR